MRLILDLEHQLEPQLKAAKRCIDEGIFREKRNTIWGVTVDNHVYGVKCNTSSIRVYP